MTIALSFAACGKKGPPLAPLVKAPAPLADLTVRRAGDTVYLRFTVPTFNADKTTPADLTKVEIYGYTALKEVDGLEPRDMTLVAEVLVRKPPDPEARREAKDEARAAKKPVQPKAEEPGVDQGTVLTVTEALTPEAQTLTRIPKHLQPPAIVMAQDLELPSKLELPAVGPVLEVRPRRFYVAYGVNHRGQRGTPSRRFAVSFEVMPAPPGAPRIEVKGKTAEISWNPPAGAAAPLQGATADGGLLPSTPRGSLLPVLPLYDIYLVNRSAPAAQGGKPAELPIPLNDKPLTDPSFVDNQAEFGVERCYQVRTVNTAGATAWLATAATPATGPTTAATSASAESGPSTVSCVTPSDRIPPPAPTALAAVASADAISLIWNSVDAPDLAGYIVLRGPSPQGPMVELFKTPIRETTYRDTTVRTGVRYVYVVVAVDTATPPNRSQASNKIEETAR